MNCIDRRPIHDRPLAISGLTSYRAQGPFGYIMIGARDIEDAWREARRSADNPTDLRVWNGDEYVPATSLPSDRE